MDANEGLLDSPVDEHVCSDDCSMGGHVLELHGGQLQDGEDFQRNDLRQKAQVVGRCRMRLMGLDTEGPLAMQKRVPLPPWAVKSEFAPRMSSTEFQRKWTRATKEAFEKDSDLVGLEGSPHNLVQGPGRFAWDVRLTKMMPVKERPDQVTLAQALAKLRSLHATLQKAFGPQWISILAGSTNRTLRKDYFSQARRMQAEETTIADPLSLFEPEDLMLRTDVFGDEPNVEHRLQKIVSTSKEPLGFVQASMKEPGLFFDGNVGSFFQKAQVTDRANGLYEIVSRNHDLLVGRKKRLQGGVLQGHDQDRLQGGNAKDVNVVSTQDAGAMFSNMYSMRIPFMKEALFQKVCQNLARDWPEQSEMGLKQVFREGQWTPIYFYRDPQVALESVQEKGWHSGLSNVSVTILDSSLNPEDLFSNLQEFFTT